MYRVRCIEHGLRFAQRRHTCNSVKERDPVFAWTNGIAQQVQNIKREECIKKSLKTL